MLVGMWTNRICRNPVLQRMFMRLGRAEKAGSGVDKIVSGWRYLGWPVPVVTEETPVGAPHKKNRQEKSEKRTDLGVLPGAKIRF